MSICPQRASEPWPKLLEWQVFTLLWRTTYNLKNIIELQPLPFSRSGQLLPWSQASRAWARCYHAIFWVHVCGPSDSNTVHLAWMLGSDDLSLLMRGSFLQWVLFWAICSKILWWDFIPNQMRFRALKLSSFERFRVLEFSYLFFDKIQPCFRPLKFSNKENFIALKFSN